MDNILVNNKKALRFGKGDQFSMYIIGTLFTWSLVTGILSCTIIPYGNMGAFIAAALAFAIVLFILQNKYTAIVAGIILFLMLVLLLADSALRGSQSSLLSPGSIIAHFNGVIQFITGFGRYRESYSATILISLSVLFSVFTGLFLKVYFNYIVLLIFGGTIYIVSFSSGFFTGDISFIAFLFCILVIMLKSFNVTALGINSNGKLNFSSGFFSISVMPLCVGIILVSALLPYNRYRVSGTAFLDEFVRKPYNAMSEILYNTFSEKYFSFSSTGFSDGRTNKLGGNVVLNRDFVMNVMANGTTYLAGSVKDEYTGNSWFSTATGFTPYSQPELYDINALSYYTAAWGMKRMETLGQTSSLAEGQSGREEESDIIAYSGRVLTQEEERYMAAYLDIINTFISESGLKYFSSNESGLNIYLVNGNGLTISTESLDDDAKTLIVEYLLSVLDSSQPVLPDVTETDTSVFEKLIWNDNNGLATTINYQTVTVDIKSKRTGTLFFPINFAGIMDISSNNTILRNSLGELRTQSLMKSNTNYTLSYFESDNPLRKNQSNDMLLKSKKGFYQDLYNYVDRTFKNSSLPEKYKINSNTYTLQYGSQTFRFNNLINNIIQPYVDEIYERYTSLPDTLPDRVRNLALDITKDYASDYEKVLALQKFISSYEYTLSPGELPSGRDFVDYFIFEGKKGYCTYYATALAVMARSIGLPSRYMEGFIVTGPANDDGWRAVTNAQAHAWVEIYFEGYGWKLFEATAAYSYLIEIPEEIYDNIDSDYYDEEYLDGYGEDDDYYSSNQDSSDINGNDSEDSGDSSKTDSTNNGNRMILYFVFAVLIFAFGFILFTFSRAVKLQFYFNRLNKSDNNTAAYGYFKLIMKYTKFCNYGIMRHETANNYAARVGQKFYFNNEKMFMSHIADIFTKSQYSGKEITDEELQVIVGAYVQFIEKIRQEMHWVQFIFYRYTIEAI